MFKSYTKLVRTMYMLVVASSSHSHIIQGVGVGSKALHGSLVPPHIDLSASSNTSMHGNVAVATGTAPRSQSLSVTANPRVRALEAEFKNTLTIPSMYACVFWMLCN